MSHMRLYIGMFISVMDKLFVEIEGQVVYFNEIGL